VIGRARVAALAAATAWLAVSAAFSAVRATSYGPLVECPPSTATLQALVSMDTYLDGALATRYRDADLNEGPMGCLGSAELTVVAFRSAPEGLGGAYAYTVEPDWMDTWQQRRWFLTPTDAENSPGFGAGPFLAVAVPPNLQGRFEGLAGQWVSVRGHFDDAAATSCRTKGAPRPRAGEVPTKADLIAMCRTSFVVLGIDQVARPCATGAIDWAAISATPEAMRARCFGQAPLDFVARGFSINNTWHLAVPDVHDWELLDPAGGSDEAAERARALEAFVPNGLDIPNPSDAPWHDRDGVGGFDVRWHVRGHFDDPAAAACRPELDGFILNDRNEPWSEEDALEFCRNHLFVDSLEWIRDGAPSASPPDSPAEVVTAPLPSARPPGPPDPGTPLQPAPPTNGPILSIVVAAAALVLAVAVGAIGIRRRPR